MNSPIACALKPVTNIFFLLLIWFENNSVDWYFITKQIIRISPMYINIFLFIKNLKKIKFLLNSLCLIDLKTENMNVLILDDENSGRQVLKKLLADYIPDATNVYLAEDFSSAQSILLKRDIDVILIDISMPEGTGFDFLDSLNYERYNIVFVTPKYD